MAKRRMKRLSKHVKNRPNALLNKRELAWYLALTPREVEGLIANGLPYISPSGGRGKGKPIYFKVASVDAWLQNSEQRVEDRIL